ncbi:MAG TPA: SpoIID/LytB domain-containing protein [Candidatus Sulfotelmatobacter sp.]|nr:SpoIID/LytB domain-containing protein [Candidatus Sulfotelmatobacter sp.]
MPTKKLVALLLAVIITILPLTVSVQKSAADQLDDINKQLSQLSDELNKSVAATQPLQSQLDNEQKQITNIKSQIAGVEADISLKKKQIDNGYTNLAQKEKIISATIRDFYVKSYYDSPLLAFFSQATMSEVTQTLAYQHAQTEQDKSIITNIALTINDLQNEKNQLQQEESWLTTTKAKLDTDTTKLNTVITGAKAYQSQLSNQIASLSQQQQQLIAQKYATLGIPTTAYTSSGGCSSDLNPYKDPGFGGTKFGFFTYGVPNRVGLNQYGAKGRAEAGQSYNDILNAYYTNFQITTMSTSSTTVTVNGTNDSGEAFTNQSFTIEDYLKHIYEMPSGWPSEALKSQAIAARSYVMHAIASGQTTVASNQSFQEVKTELNAQPWIDAVNATSGQVMTSGGQPIEAWFSSTHGGYTHASADIGWSATSYTKTAQDANGAINSWADLNNNAYDKQSPWFYCDWGSRSSANGTAWLSSNDISNIVNVILLSQTDGSTTPHLSQTDKNLPDTWDDSRVQQELKNRGVTPYTNISNISVNADFGSGNTTTVTVTGDGGSHNFSGNNFKTLFNLRAPANIQIVGPLYNVEIK